VRRQVLAAAPDIARVTSVSRAVDAAVRATTGDAFETSILPNVVDESVFVAPDATDVQDADRILFVGAVRHVKGLDVLVRAMALLKDEVPQIRLLVLGEAFYGQWRNDEKEVRRLCDELGITARVEFAGRATPDEVAETMRRSAMLVVPARRESFSAVAVEALASGTPVVATRCGGPEEFVSDANGRLVPPEDPAALAAAIRDVRADLAAFDRLELRRAVVARFGRDAIQRALETLYGQVLAADGEPRGADDATLEA
jgi:glycosyltransferase involved in cell wall biosynthesis